MELQANVTGMAQLFHINQFNFHKEKRAFQRVLQASWHLETPNSYSKKKKKTHSSSEWIKKWT